MRLSNKASISAGIILLLTAAFFSIALFLQLLGFGSYAPGRGRFLINLGQMLYSVYGFSSILIPAFLLAASLSCFASEWTMRKAIRLITAVVPFFTCVITENICRSIISAENGHLSAVKITVTVIMGLMLAAIEFLGAGMIADKITKKQTEKENTPSEDDKTDESDDEETIEPEKIDEPAESSKEKTEETVKKTEKEAAEDDKKTVPSAIITKEEYDALTAVAAPVPAKDNQTENTTENWPEAPEETLEWPELPVKDEEETDQTDSENAEDYDESEPVPDEQDESEKDEISDNSSTTVPVQSPESPAEDDPYADAAFVDSVTKKADSILSEEKNRNAPLEAEALGVENVPETEKTPDAAEEKESDSASDSEDPAAVIDEEVAAAVNNDSKQNEEDIIPLEEIKEPETAKKPTDENETSENGTLSPDFFDIDMNAVTDEETDALETNEAPAEADKAAENTDSLTLSDNFHYDEVTDADNELKATDLTANQPDIAPAVPAAVFKATTETVETTKAVTAPQLSADVPPTFSIAADVFADMDSDIRKNTPADAPAQTDGEKSNSQQQKEQTLAELFDKQPLKSETPKKAKLKGAYKIPSSLLSEYTNDQYWIIDDETKNASVQLKQTLNEFNIEADIIGIKKGPVVTMFEILPAPGVKLSKIAALQDNIALRLAASSVRIVAPIPGKQAVGIEIPNKNRSIVSFREMIEQDLPEYKKMAVPVILGKDILGKPQLLDLVKTPHLLIAGATGSGKSVCVNSMILSILYKRSPKEVKLILIDPKIVELKLYNDIPHLLTPVITEPKKAFQALQYCLCEMERRYALLDGMGCRDIASYNQRIEERHIATEKLPYIVVIIDEFADLMATTGKELESTVARLAAMSRAIGIHLVLATQRPSIDVITGLIKANIPTRIAFMVASKMDSRIIIDQVGAEKLLGRGDMLYASAVDPFPVRIQGTFVSDTEVENVVEYVKQYGEPEYIDDEIFVDDDEDGGDNEPGLFDDGEDPLYNQALEIVVQAGKASASYIQRRLKIGYNRAARLVEEMEDRGIVGPANGSKPREIIHVP